MVEPMNGVAIKIENEKVNTALGTMGGALFGLAICGPIGAAVGAFLGASLAEARSKQNRKEIGRQFESNRWRLEGWK